MIDWREHIQAIRPEAPKSGYVWVAYQSRSPYLPVAVADTAAELARSVSTLANEQKHIKTDVEEIKTDVKAIAEKPGKRWNAVVEKVILLVVGAVTVYLLARVGL